MGGVGTRKKRIGTRQVSLDALWRGGSSRGGGRGDTAPPGNGNEGEMRGGVAYSMGVIDDNDDNLPNSGGVSMIQHDAEEDVQYAGVEQVHDIDGTNSSFYATNNINKNNIIKSVLDRQCVGSLCGWSERMLESKRVGLCQCVARDGFRSWNVLSSPQYHAALYRHVGVFTCVEMDSVGELFVTGDDSGIVTVNYLSSTVESLKTMEVGSAVS